MAAPDPSLTWAALKARARVLREGADEKTRNWQIRVHRAISWLKHASELPDTQPEARLLLLWISFNSLYSAWDTAKKRPLRDSNARRLFVAELIKLHEAKVGSFLRNQRDLLRNLFRDPCLTAEFWQNPRCAETEARAIADAKTLDTDLNKGSNRKVLKQALDRLSVLRGQIVHGASTAGSALNRTAVKSGLAFLQRLVPVLIHIVLERGKSTPWPTLCYPPLTPQGSTMDESSKIFDEIIRAFKEMEAEAVPSPDGSLTGLRGYCDHVNRDRADKRNVVENLWSKRIAEYLTVRGMPSQTQVVYPGRRRRTCDLVISSPDHHEFWIEVKGEWREEIYGNSSRLNPSYKKYLIATADDVTKLLTLPKTTATRIGLLVIGFDRVGNPILEADLEPIVQRMGTPVWTCCYEDWDDPWYRGFRVRVWLWHRQL